MGLSWNATQLIIPVSFVEPVAREHNWNPAVLMDSAHTAEGEWTTEDWSSWLNDTKTRTWKDKHQWKFAGDNSTVDYEPSLFFLLPWSVRNISKFKGSCDVMELLFSRKMADRLPKRPQSPFRDSQGHICKTFHEAYTIFSSGKRIESHIGSVSWNIQHILCLISSFKQHDAGKNLVGFQGRWTSIYYFFRFTDFYEVLDIFPQLSYPLTFITLNVGIVDDLEEGLDGVNWRLTTHK